ncbi:hypothetical protein [Emticicia oligotrophica]|nr:hypothetical protein [Emticicia oligotrophica]
MKKLLLLLALSTFSFGSMAMGFPHNTYKQQRTLSKNIQQKNIVSEIENSLKVNFGELSMVKEDTNVQESLVEMFTNFVVDFFTKTLFGTNVCKVNTTKEIQAERIAVKQDFEYCLVA